MPERVVDDQGRVRCRDCGEFKPPDLMKWDSRFTDCATICKRCKRRRDAERRTNQLPITRAQWRAMRKLIVAHQDEYDDLVAREIEAIKDEVPVGVVLVPEHTRTVYARPLPVDVEGGDSGRLD